MSELPPTPDQLCASCPRRSDLGQRLARAGLIKVGSCPGPDIIDRFKVVERPGVTQPPKGYDLVAKVEHHSFKPALSKSFYSTKSQREESCPLDPIPLGEDETVAACSVNEDERVWVRIGQGKEDAVHAAEMPNFDDEPPLRTPLLVLRSMRKVIAKDS